MTFSIKYKPLFEVKINHLFFLNKGTIEYSSMSDSEKGKQLEQYNVGTFFKIIPSSESSQKLHGHNLVFRTNNSGFTIWSKVTGSNSDEPFISLNNELYFTFLIQHIHPIFLNYTDLHLENTSEILYFSNRKPDSEPVSFPLIELSGANSFINKSSVLSITRQNAELKKLQIVEQQNLFGLIRIYTKGETSSIDITNAEDKIPNPAKSFELNFKNRKTIWRYFFETNQQVRGRDDVKKENGNSKVLITKTEKPLTNNGFVSVELDRVELPNPDARIIKPDTLNNKYYSEIYM